jgi:small subunit ribosomal protein S6
MAESVNKYELMVIIDSGIGQADVDKRLDLIRKQISKHGKIFFEDIWGERDFAYQIKKLKKGFYAVLAFSFDPTELKEFETLLRLEPEVVRHLLVKLPLKYEPISLEDLKKAHLEAAEAKAEKK